MFSSKLLFFCALGWTLCFGSPAFALKTSLIDDSVTLLDEVAETVGRAELEFVVLVPKARCALPPLSLLIRNDGLLGEQVAKQPGQTMGIEFKVLQNNSRHGVDLYAHDAVNNRYVVVEVKSSTVGSYGAPSAAGPASFLQSRAALAEQGQGFWKDGNATAAVKAEGARIRQGFDTNPPAVVGYKFEVALPQPWQSAAPVITVKPWGGP